MTETALASTYFGCYLRYRAPHKKQRFRFSLKSVFLMGAPEAKKLPGLVNILGISRPDEFLN